MGRVELNYEQSAAVFMAETDFAVEYNPLINLPQIINKLSLMRLTNALLLLLLVTSTFAETLGTSPVTTKGNSGAAGTGSQLFIQEVPAIIMGKNLRIIYPLTN